MTNILCGDRIEVALSVGKMIDRIEHIGLSNTVISHKTIDFRIEGKTFRLKILVVY